MFITSLRHKQFDRISKSNKGRNTLAAVRLPTTLAQNLTSKPTEEVEPACRSSHLVVARAGWCRPLCCACRRPGRPGVTVRGMVVQSATWHSRVSDRNTHLTAAPWLKSLSEVSKQAMMPWNGTCCHPGSSFPTNLSSFLVPKNRSSLARVKKKISELLFYWF